MRPTWWSSDHWATPPELVAKWEYDYGHFDLDPCCRPETAKAKKFYTEQDDGLAQPWNGRVFLNPPYSKPAPWLAKAWEEVTSGRADMVVSLLPVRTDTRWFHDLVLPFASLVFLRGRIKWLGWQGTPIPSPKDPSMLAIFDIGMDLSLHSNL